MYSAEKRKRNEGTTLETINPRQIKLSSKSTHKPFMFLISKSGNVDTRRKYKRIAITVSNTLFDKLSPETLTFVAEYLDISSFLSLSVVCKFFNLFVNGSSHVSISRIFVIFCLMNVSCGTSNTARTGEGRYINIPLIGASVTQ